MNKKPGSGFALNKQASDVNMNDPYRSYTNSVVDQDSVWEALMTEAGRELGPLFW